MSKIPCWGNSLCSMSEAGAFYYYLPETLQSPLCHPMDCFLPPATILLQPNWVSITDFYPKKNVPPRPLSVWIDTPIIKYLFSFELYKIINIGFFEGVGFLCTLDVSLLIWPIWLRDIFFLDADMSNFLGLFCFWKYLTSIQLGLHRNKWIHERWRHLLHCNLNI